MANFLNKNIKFYLDNRIIFFPALQTILWGLWLINPYIDSFNISKNFGLLYVFGNEVEWGLFAILIGLSKIISIFSTNPKYALLSVFPFMLGVFLWTTVLISYVFGNPSSMGVASSVGFLVGAIVCLEDAMRRYYYTFHDGGI